MELIYTHVENYRNIHHQDFSFSPFFQVTISNQKLSVSYMPQPYKQILFERNHIESIHLLIGKTGSGKSNLLSLIGMPFSIRKQDFEKHHSCYFLLYHIKEQLFFLETTGYHISSDSALEITEASDSICSHFLIEKNGCLYCTDKKASLPWITSLSAAFVDDIHPKDIFSSLITRNQYNLYSDCKYYIWKHLEYYQKHFSVSRQEDSFLQKNLYCKIVLHIHDTHSISASVSPKEVFISSLEHETAKIKNNTFNHKILQSTITLLKNIPDNYYIDNSICWEIGSIHDSSLFHTIDELMHVLRNWINNYDQTIASVFSIRYENLSSGELQFVSLFANIEQLCEFSVRQQSPLILLLDEPETYMHPELCRQFMFYLTQLCRRFDGDVRFQFIITSHSPFFLSDLPSSCVTRITIHQGNGDCQVIKEPIATFGSNIHQLLSDGFFMDNTLGELSHQLIREILCLFDNLCRKNRTCTPFTAEEDEQFQIYCQFIPCIGDPVFRKELETIASFIKNGKLIS